MHGFEYELIGSSAAMVGLRRELSIAARSSAKVLITGESGAGKGMVASVLHSWSNRRPHPFTAINCAAVPDSLLESEMFGHMRGSFSGAIRDHEGLLDGAHRGTVLLDEIGDSSARMQGLLLRFLQSGEIQRVGDSGSPSLVDVRVVATTNRDLLDRIRDGAFRLDLYYRLNVIPIHVAPLRDRSEDLPELLSHFLTKFSRQYQMARPVVSPETMTLLTQYHWPGNVRELRNAAERLVVRGESAYADLAGLGALVA